MAYADQGMSTRKAVSIGIVVALHALLGYAFITGLAFTVIKKAATDLKVVDVTEPPPPPEKPPPPPPPQPQQKVEPPPLAAPPRIVNVPQTPTFVAPPPPPVSPPPAPVTVAAPPAPPSPTVISQVAGAKGDPAQWITNDDYPPGALRDEKSGVVKVSWQINEQGRVENCQVVTSSGVPELDETTCRLLVRRGRYTPAKDQNGNPVRSSSSRTVRWQVPNN